VVPSLEKSAVFFRLAINLFRENVFKAGILRYLR